MKIDRKTEIVSCAARLFREKGYSGVTMRDIAKALDMKAASLHNHISSKQEILSLMILSIAGEYTRNIREIEASGATAVEKIDSVISLHIDITVSNADALASLNNDWMNLPAEHLSSFLQMREDYEQIFRKIVGDGMASGELRPHNPEVVIFSILSTLRTLYLWYGRRADFTPEILRSDLREVLLKGIA